MREICDVLKLAAKVYQRTQRPSMNYDYTDIIYISNDSVLIYLPHFQTLAIANQIFYYNFNNFFL
jgi:hypothetical protein